MNNINMNLINEDILAEIFEELEESLESVNDEPVAVMTENETYVIMTLDEFEYLQGKSRKEQTEPYIKTFLESLEGLSAEELEGILSLATSQLNIKMAKEYFYGKELE